MKTIICDICNGQIRNVINGITVAGVGDHLHIKAYKFRNNDGQIIKGKK